MIISIDQPLVPTRDQPNTNAVYITLEGLYSPPEAWFPGGTSFIYTAALPVPINDDVSSSSNDDLFILWFSIERNNGCIHKWYTSCGSGCNKQTKTLARCTWNYNSQWNLYSRTVSRGNRLILIGDKENHFVVISSKKLLMMNKANYVGKMIENFEPIQRKSNHKWYGIWNGDVFSFRKEVRGRHILRLSWIANVCLQFSLVYSIKSHVYLIYPSKSFVQRLRPLPKEKRLAIHWMRISHSQIPFRMKTVELATTVLLISKQRHCSIQAVSAMYNTIKCKFFF